MDKNLNSSPKLPWWVVTLQLSPLILQLVGEFVLRFQGIPHSAGLAQVTPPSEVVIPGPVEPGSAVVPE